jgi:flagella basal body P-ring formation protein FlgA
MKGVQVIAVGALLSVLAMSAGRAAAWEVRLRAHVSTQAAMVRLHDIADLVGNDVPADPGLDQLVVALGPSPSRSRELTPSDVRKALVRHEVDLKHCEFTGATRVAIAYGENDEPAHGNVASGVPTRAHDLPQPRATTPLQQRLEELVAQELQKCAGDGCPWQAKVSFPECVPENVLGETSDITLDPVACAKEGTHRLVAYVAAGSQSARVPLAVQARRLTPAVVLVRALARGEVVRPDDVQLRYLEKVADPGAVVQRLEDAVGRQTRQAVDAEQPMNVRWLQQPLLVRRRDEVDVSVRCGGIHAHRRAVALNDGAQGDMISVETADQGKTSFNARVVGIRQVEVLPNSTGIGQ